MLLKPPKHAAGAPDPRTNRSQRWQLRHAADPDLPRQLAGRECSLPIAPAPSDPSSGLCQLNARGLLQDYPEYEEVLLPSRNADGLDVVPMSAAQKYEFDVRGWCASARWPLPWPCVQAVR